MSINDLRDTIVPKSDQLNAEQLLTGAITVTVTKVSRGNAEQPIVINYAGDNGRPYKPCKTTRKLLIFAWGEDGAQWIGRSMTLFCDPDVQFGGQKVGGIRISHMSHIDRDLEVSLTATRGKKTLYRVKRLDVQPAGPDAKTIEKYRARLTELSTDPAALAEALDKTPDAIKQALGADFIAGLQSAPAPVTDPTEEVF